MGVPLNLNKEVMRSDDPGKECILHDNSVQVGDISVFFKNIKNHLIGKINENDYVVGNVAWLTDPDILKALSTLKSVAIVVQKEDFLRPDIGSTSTWKESLQELYKVLPGEFLRENFPSPLSNASFCRDPSLDAVRCVGNYNRDKRPAFPRAHNKFVVFLEKTHEDKYKAKAVWTGSFNFTKNAGYSFENAVFIENQEVADAYLKEFAQIATLSEPLNWNADWVAPEWRLGS